MDLNAGMRLNRINSAVFRNVAPSAKLTAWELIHKQTSFIAQSASAKQACKPSAGLNKLADKNTLLKTITAKIYCCLLQKCHTATALYSHHLVQLVQAFRHTFRLAAQFLILMKIHTHINILYSKQHNKQLNNKLLLYITR